MIFKRPISKCVVIADKEPELATVIAHLLWSVFDTTAVKRRLNKRVGVYITGPLVFESAIAAEIIGSPFRDFRIPANIARMDVAALLTCSGFGHDDHIANQLVQRQIPVLQMSEFHPNKANFAEFHEDEAGQPLALALAEASVEVSKYLVENVLAD